MILLRLGFQEFRKEFAKQLPIILQMACIMFITIACVTSVNSRLQYLSSFRSVLEYDGTIFYSGGSIGKTEEKLRRQMTGVHEIAFTYQYLYAHDGFPQFYAYDEPLMRMNTPEMIEGTWCISNPDDSMANVMVNESSGYHVGDIIALPYESGPETVDLRVAGVYDERAKLLLLNGAAANAEIRDYRFLLSEVDSIQPDSAWSNDSNSMEEIQKKGQLNIFMSTTEAEKYFNKDEHLANGWVGVVTYEDGLTIDEKTKNDEMLRVAFCNPTISLTTDAMLENSYNYAMEQVYALVPVLVSVLVLFVISMISVNSVSAVRKQRTYMVYRICGLQWQRCVWITGLKAAFNSVCAIAICFVLMYIKQKYNLFDELLIATGWGQVAFCLLFAIVNIIFAMSISSVILRRAEIRKILKES